MKASMRRATLYVASICGLAFALHQPVALAESDSHAERASVSHADKQDRASARLERLAKRLQLQPEQQTVWRDYAEAMKALSISQVSRPDKAADITTFERYRRDRAAEFASKMDKVVDATSRLEAALTQGQRQILQKVAKRKMEKSMRSARGDRAWKGERQS